MTGGSGSHGGSMERNRTLLLRRKDVRKIVSIKEAVSAIERVFKSFGRGRVQMPPKLYIHLHKHKGDFRAMPAYVEDMDSCAIKWVNVHPNNSRFGMPAVMAVNILSDPRNGFPLCIMDGTYATNLRTGAAGGVAAKYLARKNSEIVGMVGCGAQARTQLQALNEVFNIKEVRVWGHKAHYIKRFIRDMKRLGLSLKAAESIEECLRGCDIVVTTTPSRRPVVRLKWLKKGVHINAIGADAIGKEELEPAILKKAKIVVDAWEQASHSGEINVPLRKKLLSRKDIYANIGQIAAGKKRGRTSNSEITVFDSTGLAIQDVVIANLIYKAAIKKKVGEWIKLI